MLMDAVFGAANFRNEIVWKRTSRTDDADKVANTLAAIQTCILFYAKTEAHSFEPQFGTVLTTDYVDKLYKYVEEEPAGGIVMSIDRTRRRSRKAIRSYEVQGSDCRYLALHPRAVWRN